MLAQIDTRKLLLPGQELTARDLGLPSHQLGFGGCRSSTAKVEETHLTPCARFLALLPGRDRRIQRADDPGARSEAVHRPTLRQAFGDPLVDTRPVDRLAKGLQVSKSPTGLLSPGVENGPHRPFADVLDRP